MMSSTQYPITSTIINVTQNENMHNNVEEFQQKSLVNIRIFDETIGKDEQSVWNNIPQQQNIKAHGNIATACFESLNSNKSKISIACGSTNDDDDQHISSDGREKLNKSLVSFLPSSDSDGDFSDENQHRHILKIQISPATDSRKTSSASETSAVVDNRKLNKSSSIIVNSNNRKKKMSVVSGGGRDRCENDSIYKNVTIIRNGSSNNSNSNDEYDIENLSDDQKLVLNGHHITVKCGSGPNNNKLIRNNKAKELIQLTTTTTTSDASVRSNSNNNNMNIVNCNSDGIILSSGQCSPEECVSVNGEDHLDSGTCSDVEVNGLTCSNYGLITTTSMSASPPPLPPKGYKKKAPNLSESTCSDASSASSSTDSMQYQHQDDQLKSPTLIRSIEHNNKGLQSNDMISGLLPRSLLHDIRNHSMKAFLQSSLIHNEDDCDEEEDILGDDEDEAVIEFSSGELNYSDISISNDNENNSNNVKHEHSGTSLSSTSNNNKLIEVKSYRNSNSQVIEDFFDDDKFYKFHINEHSSSDSDRKCAATHEESDESFAGYKDLKSGSSTIRSAKGTIRGVKNRVRNGIATFLQMQQTTVKNYKEKDGGKIVLYTTSMGVVRSTYAKCQAVKQILRTLMVKFEERDVFMSYNHQQDIRERMQTDDIDVPQLYVDGHYVGNADHVERLNESGELRIMLKPFKSRDSLETCSMCGGFKMLPCTSCGGSKKSIHRNHFTADFLALKCMNCDEVGLVKCYNCA